MRTKMINGKRLKLFLLMILFVSGLSTLKAQLTTVTPIEYTEGMKNPLMGLRENASKASSRLPYNTVVRAYIHFNELDNASTDGLQKIIDYTNTNFKDYEKWNIKVIVRVILQYSDDEYYWPADLSSIEGDYTNATLRARVLKLVDNIGKAWDNDPRIAWVEMGLIGKWGEQESPMGVDEPGVNPDGKSWAQILGPAFRDAFKNKHVQVRGMSKWTEIAGFEPGMYWDTWGSYISMTNPDFDYNAELIKYNNPPYDRYKEVSLGGEIAYGVGTKPELIGTNATDSYKDAGHRRWIKNCAAQCRTSVLGLEYSSTDQSAAALEGLKDLLKGFGYRFLIKEFQCSQQTAPGGNMTVNAKIVNAGIAPLYEKWPLAFVLINESTKQIVWKTVLPNVDISTWMPGENYDWETASTLPGTGTEKFLIPAAVNNISATITIPANLSIGTYYAGLAILDPTTDLPGVFFSVNNFFKASNTHPLSQIGIGVAPNNPTLTNVSFDNYDFLNDTRYYNLTYGNVLVTGVSIIPSTLSVGIGKAGQLTPNVLPTNATNKNVTWSSSNTAVATVDANGKVTGVALGNAIITVTTADGGFTATSIVTVIPTPPCNLPWNTPDFSLGMASAPYSSGEIDISCASSVKLHMELSENDYFESEDILTVSYKLDGAITQIVKLINDFNTGYIVDLPSITGNSLEILITGLTHDALEIYNIKNVSVTSNGSNIKQDQTISFSAIAEKTFGAADFNPGATASSGLTVTYSSSNTAVATIIGSNIHIVGAGVADITASQSGNVNYNAAPSVVQTLTVNRANQTISFPAIATKSVGDSDFNPGATSSSGLAISYSSSDIAVATLTGGNIHIVGEGTSTITASQAGNANYNAATNVSQLLTVTINNSNPVTAISAWVKGNINNKVSGSNRLMIVMVMGESGSDISANSVTYGGRVMTKQSDVMFASGYRTYSGIFTLDEAGVNAATTGTIAVSWSGTPSGSDIYSVLLSNVDQTTPIVAQAKNGLNGTLITTSALSASTDDMIVMCGATGTNNTITFNNGFTKSFESNGGWGDGIGGYKMGSGVNETPSFTQSSSGRLTLCAVVVKKSGSATSYTLTETSPSGSIEFNPAGGVYPAGTDVIVTAIPASGYKFDSFGGDLVGVTSNPTTITMTSNKSIIGNFSIIDGGDPIPWNESFTKTDGTTSNGAPTSWSAVNLRVLSNEIAFNNVGADGLFTTGVINISGNNVRVSLNVRGGSGLDVGYDFLKLYKKVDGGAEVQIAAADGPLAATTWNHDITSGNSLVLILKAHVTSTLEYYYFDNLSVISTGLKSALTNEKEDIIGADDAMIVYPNPVSNILNIEFSNDMINREVSVYNTVGQLVSRFKTNSAQTQIDVQALKLSGIAIVQVISGKTVSNHRILVK